MFDDPYEHLALRMVLLMSGGVAPIAALAVAGVAAVQALNRGRRVGALAAALLGLAAPAGWWLMAGLAARWAGWVDPDGDGIYADFENGSYDRVDVTGWAWGLLCTGWSLAIAAAVMLLVTRARPARKEGTGTAE